MNAGWLATVGIAFEQKLREVEMLGWGGDGCCCVCHEYLLVPCGVFLFKLCQYDGTGLHGNSAVVEIECSETTQFLTAWATWAAVE